MSTPEFDIIFRGDIVLGHQLADVKLKLQQLFKVDAAKIDALFTGRPVPLKRNLDEATANKYRDVLINAGAMVDISPSDKTPSTPATRPVPASSERANEKAREITTESTNEAQSPQAQSNTEPPKPTEWTLAPAGSYLIAPLSRPKPTPPVIDLSNISLSPVGGNLVDASELPRTEAATTIAPDFDLADLGANLVEADEKIPLPIVEFDLEDWEIAAAGSDLLKPEEHIKVTPVVVDVSQFNLAPAGSDLGQLKAQVKAVVPDISGITLADSN